MRPRRRLGDRSHGRAALGRFGRGLPLCWSNGGPALGRFGRGPALCWSGREPALGHSASCIGQRWDHGTAGPVLSCVVYASIGPGLGCFPGTWNGWTRWTCAELRICNAYTSAELVSVTDTYSGFRPGGGHLLSKGPPGHPGAPRRLGPPGDQGLPATRAP